MKTMRHSLAILAMLLTYAFMAGCEQDTAERVGRQVGEATRQVEEKAGEAAEALKQGAEKFKEGYRDAGES